MKMQRRTMSGTCCSLLLLPLIATAEKAAVTMQASSSGSLLTFGGGRSQSTLPTRQPFVWRILRGGERELTLDEKVHAAMEKLGLHPPAAFDDDHTDETGCENGVCEMPQEQTMTATAETTTTTTTTTPVTKTSEKQEDPQSMAQRIAQTMKIDSSMAWAALGATSTVDDNNKRIFHEHAAREMIQLELEMIEQITEDCEEVQKLVSEGYEDTFLVRRALAFAERNIDDARAILIADKLDEEEENAKAQSAQEKAATEASFKTITVDANFDPTKLSTSSSSSSSSAAPSNSAKTPKPAAKQDVIFDITASQVQEIVIESPVPVLLDVYADWCGPCKALSPILEDFAIKSGGAFRLVKVNSDNERAISTTLEVTALPTIFGIRDGKILNMFQGMPRSEDMMKNFMMGLLIPGQSFEPPVTAKENQKYEELSLKLLKVAGAAAYPFSARERLQDHTTSRLDDLVVQTGNVYDAEQSAQTIRSLLSNIVRDPFSSKFRTVNLDNKVIAAKVSPYPAALAMLKSVGFTEDKGAKERTMSLPKNKRIVNVAPIAVARDSIDKWIDKTRYEVARAARHRKDEEDRKRLAEEASLKENEADDDEDEEVPEANPDECRLKLRLDGKKKLHELVLHADDPLKIILDKFLAGADDEDDELQITCVAKRLIIRSTDNDAMNMSLREHGLVPAATLVIKSISNQNESSATPKLAERAASKRKRKTGSHTMQSVGIYGKDDNAKGELIDGGGGTLYEHDVTDDEEEVQQPDDEMMNENDVSGDSAEKDEKDS